MNIWKEQIPGPGTYWYKDQETGQPRTIAFTPEGIQHLHDTGKAMLAQGLSIPVPLEHQPWALPMSAEDLAAQRTRHNVGSAKDFRLSPEGGLEALLDIDDPDILKKLGKTLLWTSPYITSFTDGAGTDWRNVVGHVAITTRPRITHQQPFPTVAAALALLPQLPAVTFEPRGSSSRPIPVVAAGRLVPHDEAPGLYPQHPVAFSLHAGVALAGVEAAGRRPRKGKGMPSYPMAKDATPKPAAEPTAHEAREEEGAPERARTVDPDGDIPVWEVIRDLLESEGFVLPEETTADTFAENMYHCLMSKRKGGQEEDLPRTDTMTNQPPTGSNPLPSPPAVIAEQPPLYMSLADVQKVKDPVLQQALRLGLSLQENAFNQAKVRRQERMDRLLRRLPPPRREAFGKKIRERLPHARLSLTAEGTVTDDMDEWLALLEEAVDALPDPPALLQSPARFQEVPHPQEYAGGTTPERQQAVADELCHHARLPAREAS